MCLVSFSSLNSGDYFTVGDAHRVFMKLGPMQPIEPTLSNYTAVCVIYGGPRRIDGSILCRKKVVEIKTDGELYVRW